jgi:hypothetical protein
MVNQTNDRKDAIGIIESRTGACASETKYLRANEEKRSSDPRVNLILLLELILIATELTEDVYVEKYDDSNFVSVLSAMFILLTSFSVDADRSFGPKYRPLFVML